MRLLASLMWISIQSYQTSGQMARPMYGIPVPGQTLSAMEIFALHENSCSGNVGKQRNYAAAAADSAAGGPAGLLGNSLKLLSSNRGESLAQQAYNSLFYAVGEVQIEALMGKWYRVVSSPSVHPEKCVVEYFELGSTSAYTSSFTTRAYNRKADGGVQIVQGYGYRLGPDAGLLLLMTGHDQDKCPASVVKTGPLNSDGQYSYVILTPLLKFPIIGLARDPYIFTQTYKDEVSTFLQKQNFVNPLNPYNVIAYTNWTECQDSFYLHLNA